MSEKTLEAPSREDPKSCAVLSAQIDAVIRGEDPNMAIAALVISLSELAYKSYFEGIETIDEIEYFAHRIGNSVRISIKDIKAIKEKRK